jgi:hypothetical protein
MHARHGKAGRLLHPNPRLSAAGYAERLGQPPPLYLDRFLKLS